MFSAITLSPPNEFANSHLVPLAGPRFGRTEYLYGDYPNEAGPKATRSENRVVARLAFISAIYTLVPSRLPSGEEEQQINVAISATPARLVRRCQVER